MDTTSEYDEYRCSACKKPIKNQIVQCKTCPKLFYHPGCVSRHKIYDRNKELVPCKGPFEKLQTEETEILKPPITGADVSRDRLGSSGSSSGSRGLTSAYSVDAKIDWLVRTVRSMKDEAVTKKEVKTIIKEIVQEEMENMKQVIEELKKMIQEGSMGLTREVIGTYSEAVKEKKKEKIIIVKPKAQQESEVTKKAIKEKVDIKGMAVGVTKLKKGSKGTVILGCDTEQEIEILKATVQDKMGEDFKVTESTKLKPKIKIVNVDREELQLSDDELLDTIKRQNEIKDTGGRNMKIVKRLNKGKGEEWRQGGGIDGSVIIEVDEGTHEVLLSKGKLSVGWRKCPVYNHVNVKRCFKCWGYYHIAKNCKKEETCYICAGGHNARECKTEKNKCINCMFKNQKYNLRINEEHSALDRECPTYKKAMQEEKKRSGWLE